MADELAFFMDPVDGTQDFVEGRMDAVQTLISVTLRGRAVVGVVGLTVHDGAVGREAGAAPSRAVSWALVSST